MNLSVVIPTLGRGEVLLATIRSVLALAPCPLEVIVVDQTLEHEPEVAASLLALAESGAIRWHKRSRPSIPAAMNHGLVAARSDIVLFLDDDVEPAPALIEAHLDAHRAGKGAIIAGQVLQPGEEPEPPGGDGRFSFRSSHAQAIDRFMGGNFSIDRSVALALRGFDESFVGAAYRFEVDLAIRARRAGFNIWFEPRARILHLRAATGGTRARGSHLTTMRPAHSVGEYYLLLRHRPPGFLCRCAARPWRSIHTRHHLRRPWWIPGTLCAEVLGMVWALRLAVAPPRLLNLPRPERAPR